MAKYQGLTAYNFGDEDFVTLNGSIGATLGVSGGFIMDRMGNVYYSAGAGMVFGVSAGVSTGKFKADTSSWGPDHNQAAHNTDECFLLRFHHHALPLLQSVHCVYPAAHGLAN